MFVSVFSTPITKRWNLVYSLVSLHFEEWPILVWYNDRFMHLKTINKAVVSWDASYELIELVSRKKADFPLMFVEHLFAILCEQRFCHKGKKGALVLFSGA